DQAILHLIDEIEPYDIKIGMRVKAVWREPEERIGAITDIKYFKVIE
ncbi:MAG: DNA-binding protein, partial [Deltaproteobacteria bacterium]